jgi:methylase of polypeptide subunit release factors
MSQGLSRSESGRQRLQLRIDSSTSRADRRDKGQYPTPHGLASSIVRLSLAFLPPKSTIQFLDPAFGTGVFLSALLGEIPVRRLESATGFELDATVHQAATHLWRRTQLDLRSSDFTSASPLPSELANSNLVICNPPYVRHELMSYAQKRQMRQLVEAMTGVRLSSRSGLHAYFLLLAHMWLSDGGVGAWVLPGWATDVVAGEGVRHYLTDRVQLLRVHLFRDEDIEFGDAALPPMVVWLQKGQPAADHQVIITAGSDVEHPMVSTVVRLDSLQGETKWGRLLGEHRGPIGDAHLDDLFVIRRGIATGGNRFFVLAKEEALELRLPSQFLRPLLPSPRDLLVDEVIADTAGGPALVASTFLLDCDLPIEQIEVQHPDLFYYLRCGEAICSRRATCRQRNPWYSQEQRQPAPFLCTYMGRPASDGGRPFRFILNHSNAIATNGYLMMYPRPHLEQAMRTDPSLKRRVWESLTAIPLDEMVREGRSYGRGLCKLEPRELGRVCCHLPGLSDGNA